MHQSLQLRAKLPYANDASFDSFHSQHNARLCLPETRIAILEDICTWIEGLDSGDKSIFWLNGMAGTGKSTVARTIAHKYAGLNKLGASFFFSGVLGTLAMPENFALPLQLIWHVLPSL